MMPSQHVSAACFCLFSLLFVGVSCTVTVGQRHYQSMPAVFGMPWRAMGRYQAHLQVLEEDPFLCEGAGKNFVKERRYLRNATIVEPTDGLPVVLLVSRGACSFEEKARTAMTFESVSYVIVYADRARSSLVPMSAGDPDGITVGLLFIAHTSGLLLHHMLVEQLANLTAQGGPIITMDARAPSMPPSYNVTQQWVLAAMAGFFTFLACFGCLLVCIQAGLIPSDGRIVIGRISAPTGRRLLSEMQVNKLPQEIFCCKEGDNHDDHGLSCAICIEEYQQGDTLRVLPCSHKFHTACIIPWLTERSSSCPLCKYEITRNDIEGDEESRGVGWWWVRRRSGRTIVSTEDDDDGASVETPQESLIDEAPPSSPTRSAVTASATNDAEDTGSLIPSEVT